MVSRLRIGRSVIILVLCGLGMLAFVLSVAISPREAKVALLNDALFWSTILVLLSRLLLLVAWVVTIMAMIARREGKWLALAVLIPAVPFALWPSIAHRPEFFQTSAGWIVTVGTLMVTLWYAMHDLLPLLRGQE